MPPRFQKGSIPDRLSLMSPGDVLLVSDNGAPASNQMQNLSLTLQRVEKKVAGRWQVQTCYGLKASDMLDRPFRFYRIERIA